MAPQVRLVPVLLVSLAATGCMALGAGVLGGGSGHDREAIEALKAGCEMKKASYVKGKVIELECFDPERWR